MKITTVKKLQQKFQGKICTIMTHPIAKRDFNDAQFADFFTGVVDEIDDDGIFTTHALTACKNFYFFSQVIGIIEEQVLDQQNPEHIKIIEEVKDNMKNPKKTSETNEDQFINIEDLAELTAKLQKGKK